MISGNYNRRKINVEKLKRFIKKLLDRINND